MRPDMAKVVTESPRWGHANRSKKFGRRLNATEIDEARFALWDDEHAHETGFHGDFDSGPTGKVAWSSGRNKDCKQFSDLLGPLRGYLRKQVGRPWDKVWSELSAHLDKRSITGQHIFDHIRMEVEQHCWMGVSGTVYARGRYRTPDHPVDGLYVHPFTHLLCYAKRQRRQIEPKPITVIVLDKLTKLELLDGLWFRCHYVARDVYVEPIVDRNKTILRQGYWKKEFVLQRKKQLSRVELRAAGLKNHGGLTESGKVLAR